MNDYYLYEQVVECEDTGEVCKGYNAYLKSKHWALLRNRLISKGCVCGLCGKSNKVLQLHHRIYKRLGHEKDRDLVPLCTECHEYVHKQEKWYDVKFPYWVVGGGKNNIQQKPNTKSKKKKKHKKKKQKEPTTTNNFKELSVSINTFLSGGLIDDPAQVDLLDTMSGKYTRRAIREALRQNSREYKQFMKDSRKQERKLGAEALRVAREERRQAQLEKQAEMVREHEQAQLKLRTSPKPAKPKQPKIPAKVYIVNSRTKQGVNCNAKSNTSNT